MTFPRPAEVEALRKMYPEGTRIRLERMDDYQAPPIGTLGTVLGVDDMGSIMVVWDNGFGLNVVYGEDRVSIISKGSILKHQIKMIQDSGETNMFDTYCVQYLANQRGYHELVIFLEEHRSEYVKFIFSGDEADLEVK